MEIWVKGIYTPEDVILAIEHHVDGIIISNHGGRQLDGVPATLDVLRECAPIAAGKIPIAIDGGIRRGADIFRALALGASHCFVGRVPVWGLAVSMPVPRLLFNANFLSSIMASKVWSWLSKSSCMNSRSLWPWPGSYLISPFLITADANCM